MNRPSDPPAATAWPAGVWWACGVIFVLLATANAAGYRYGTSDQAFHVPAVLHAVDPATFPRDAPLLDAQARLMVTDEVLAHLVRDVGLPMPWTFLGVYLLSLGLLWWGLVLVGQAMYGSPWLILTLGAVCTLRHRVPQTSVNSLEPYYNPRMLAFAMGVLAIAAVQRRRPWTGVTLVAVAALVHVTTALWFAIFAGVAIAVLDPAFRRLAWPGVVLAAGFLWWATGWGPLQASLARMDAVWLQAVASKDSLFAQDWPLWAWLANLGLLPLAAALHAWRRRRGLAHADERAWLWGGAALLAVFLLTLPLVGARLALPTQLQISRVFWLLDLLATLHLVGAISGTSASRAAAALAVALSMARGGYVMLVEHPERPLFGVHLPSDDWQAAMTFVAAQPRETHVLADPGHAWKYGTSVRVAAGRDVFLEEVKDAAIAIYDRSVAARVVERTEAAGDFAALTPGRARALARQYDLDLLVTESDLDLPLASRNGRFRVYRLADPPR